MPPYPYWSGQTMASQADQTWLYWTASTTGTTVAIDPGWPINATNSGTQTWSWNVHQNTVEAWARWMANLPADERRRREHKSVRERLIRSNRTRSADLRRRIASRAAERLLLDNLTEEQAEQWRTEQAFTLEMADGMRRYRIRKGIAGNITLVKDGEREAEPGSYLRRYCFHAYHPDGEQCPPEDHCLAQKLFIETAEEEFLRLANAS